MNKPTQEQIKEFWEWCGCTLTYEMPLEGDTPTYYGLNPQGQIAYLRLDLNNLFKYAVPKLPFEKIHDQIFFIHYATDEWRCQLGDYWGDDERRQTDILVIEDAETPALALFWAIYKVIKAPGENTGDT